MGVVTHCKIENLENWLLKNLCFYVFKHSNANLMKNIRQFICVIENCTLNLRRFQSNLSNKSLIYS